MFLCACTEKDSSITFETVTINKTVNLSNDSVPPKCNVNITLERATEDSGRAGEIINSAIVRKLFNREDDEIEVAANAFVNEYTSNYINTLLPLYNQDRNDSIKRIWYHYHYIINSRTQKGCNGTLVYIADINYREGGTHAVNEQISWNFDEKTGRQITINDIFVDGFEEKLTPILLKALMESVGVSSVWALRQEGYLKASDMFVPENFILGDETITFVFNPDEIAPSAIGPTELTISYTEIEDIMKLTFEH